MSFLDTLSHWFHPRRSNNHRPRVLHAPVLAGLTVAVIGLAALAQPAKFVMNGMGNVLGYASNINASDVIAQINQQRQTSGAPALVPNSALNQAAFAKAQNMFTQQYWAHVAPDGTQPWFFFKQAGYNYSIAGENLARDFANTPDMVSAWMQSPTHKENIMNARYRETGVAVVNGTLLGTETTLVVQLFGSPQTQVPQISDQGQTAPAPAPAVKPAVKAATTTSAKPTKAQLLASPTPLPTPVDAAPTEVTIINQPSASNTQTLGTEVLPITTLAAPPLFSPLQLIKVFFLAIIFVLSTTLFYDWVIMSNTNTVRLVGKNLAHILLFLATAFLLVFFKGGIIG